MQFQLSATKLQQSYSNQSLLTQNTLPSWPVAQQHQPNFGACSSLAMQYHNAQYQQTQQQQQPQQHQQILSSTPDSGIQSIDGSPPSILSYTPPMISPCNNQVYFFVCFFEQIFFLILRNFFF